MAERLGELAEDLWPFLRRRLTVAGAGSGGAGAGDHGGLTGLGDDDHPHYLTVGRGDGRYATLADLTAHAALVDVHHDQVHALVGGDHTATGLTAGEVVRATGASAFGWGRLQHADLGGVAPDQHHAQVHSIVGGDHTISGSQFQVVGAAAANVLGLLTPAYNPGAAAALLRSSAAGELELPIFTATTRVRTGLVDTASGDLTLAPASGVATVAGLHAGTRVRTGLIDTAAGNLTVQPAGDLMLAPGSNLVRLAAGRFLQSDNYASQATGMRVSAAGEGDFRYLYTDELHAKSFIADLEQALAGGQIISKSVAVLAVDFVLPAAGSTGTLRVRDLPSAPNMAVFVAGDFVGMRQFSRAAGSLSVGWAWGTVTAYADQSDGSQTWTFTRHASTPGAASGTVAAESLVLDFGVTGNGFYEVNAVDGVYGANSPYWRVVSWAGHPATQTVRVQGGNLRGLFGVANEYGFYAGDGVGTGNAYLRLSSQTNEFRNLTARWFSGGVEKAQIAPASGLRFQSDMNESGWQNTIGNRIEWLTNLAGGTGSIAHMYAYVGLSSELYINAEDMSSGRHTTLILGARTAVGSATIGMAANGSGASNGFISLLAATSIDLSAPAITVGGNYAIWHAGNDGEGSGLDADKLDNRHADSFWRGDNDGAGSGLDADLLDGSHAGSFALLSGATFTGQLFRDVTASNYYTGIMLRTSGDLATSTGSDYMTLFHLTDNEMAIGVADGAAWRTLVLQPYGGTVDVRGSLFGDSAAFVGTMGISGAVAAGTYQLDVLGSAGAARDVLRAGVLGVSNGLLVRYTSEMEYSLNDGIVVASGRVGYDWNSLTPGGGWGNYGGGNAAFGVKRFGSLVSVKGVLLAGGAIASNTSIYTLASEYRPSSSRHFVCYGAAGAVRVIVGSDGAIRPQAAFSVGDYLSVEMVFFTGG